MKKIVSILILFPILFNLFPSISTSAPEDRTVSSAIVLLKTPLSKKEIGQLVQTYQQLELEFVYETIFPGFSVKGSKRAIDQLKKDVRVLHTFRSTTHQLQYTIGDERKKPYWKEAAIDLLQDGQKNSENQLANDSFSNNQLSNSTDQNFSYEPYNSLQKPISISFIGTDNIRNMTDEKGERLTGKGIKVGIIDTGIDYTHPDLIRNYEKGYDFVDRDEDPLEKDVGTIHGTHVAGIIAANGKMVGMAPEAQLYVYRALGADGRGTTEQILAAIDQAIKDGVDILNLSLGIQINGPDLPTSIAIDAAVKRGIVAVVSSGNAGPHLWTVGSPGTSQKAISVGASTPPLKIPYLEYRQNYFPLKTVHSFERWDFFRSYPLRHENEWTHRRPENGDALVLVEKGTDPLSEKIKTLANEGVKGVIVTGYSEEELGTYVHEFQSSIPLPVYALSKENGNKLKALMERKTFAQILWKREEDVLAPFSSRGPVSSTWNIKPDLLAPGVSITSTVPGGYLTLHGTSMAAPHVTGACALLKQKHPDWSPEKIKAVLMNTSTPLQRNRYKTFEQGAGRIRVDEAFRTETIIEPGAIVFGKATENTFKAKSASVTVENVSDKPIRYTFHHPNEENTILWDFPSPFYLKPGEKKTIDLSVHLKKFSKTNEMVEGYIEMNAGQQTFHIPYLYVIHEPNYPRLMFFTIEGNKRGTIRYEMYLPGGAEQLWIIFLDPLTGGVIRYIKEEKGVPKGLAVKEIELNETIPPGTYLAIAIAKKSGREDYLQQWVDIPVEE